MNILISSNCCSRSKNEEIFKLRKKKIIVPAQKFLDMLIRGMCEDDDVHITCISALPVSSTTSDIRFWKKNIEIESDKLRYIYLSFINGRILRYLCVIMACGFTHKIYCYSIRFQNCYNSNRFTTIC